jgi:hypothetical protein
MTSIALALCVAVSGLVVVLTRQNPVKPDELASATAAQWMVHRPSKSVVLVDGFSGNVMAAIRANDDTVDAITVQGSGGAFLVFADSGEARAISSSNIRLGTKRALGALASNRFNLGVGADGLTVVDSTSGLIDVLSTDSAARSLEIPTASDSIVTDDGSVWLLRPGGATQIAVSGRENRVFDVAGARDAVTAVGNEPLTLDRSQRLVHWVTGGRASVRDLANGGQAILQEPGDKGSCAWVASGDSAVCVNRSGIERTATIPGLAVDLQSRLAIAGDVAVVIRPDNTFDRFNLVSGERLGDTTQAPASTQSLDVTVSNGLIWIDDLDGDTAWVAQQYGLRTIDKSDDSVPEFGADGQAVAPNSPGTDDEAPGGAEGDDGQIIDDNGVDDPPIAVDDEVTAGADKATITISVTNNDYDPDGDAIAVSEVEPPGYGETWIVNATTVGYKPEPNRWGEDSFGYTIIDENGNTATAQVLIEIFSPDRENQAPITRDDSSRTPAGVPVEIDVLANDTDPERDVLEVEIEKLAGDSTVRRIRSAAGGYRLLYTPGPNVLGEERFTYFAVDQSGLKSRPTEVVVLVTDATNENKPPIAAPDAIRVRTDQPTRLAVLANDIDPDNDLLTLTLPANRPPGLSLRQVGQQLEVVARAGLAAITTFNYRVTDTRGQSDVGTVLVLLDNPATPNRPPLANPDSPSIVAGTSIQIPVLANDTDPDGDPLSLINVELVNRPGYSAEIISGNSIQFTSRSADLETSDRVSFDYEIADPFGLRAIGQVTVTIRPADTTSVMTAVDDEVTVRAGSTVIYDVLNNDTTIADPPSINGQPVCRSDDLRVRVQSRGNVIIEAVATAAPATRIVCTYVVVDQVGSTDTGQIFVTIEAAPTVNTPPRLATTAPIAVFFGDPALAVDLSQRVIDDDGDQLTFRRNPQPGLRGTATLEGATLRYTPPATGTTNFPEPVVIFAEDDENDPVTLTISFDVRVRTTGPPVADDLTTRTEERVVRLDWRSRVSDPGGGTNFTAQVARASGASVEVDGSAFVVRANDDYFGTFVTTYTVTDEDGDESLAKRISVTFDPPANEPPVARADSLVVESGGSGQVDVLLNDVDIDDTRLEAFLISDPTTPRGEASLTRAGVFRFDASPAQRSADLTFEYEVVDSAGQKSRSTVAVRINECSVATPVINAPLLTVGLFERPFIDLNDFVDNGTVIPDSVTGTALPGVAGNLTVPSGFEGVVTVGFKAKNDCNITESGSLSIQVNRPPVAQPVQLSLGRGATLDVPISQLASDDEPLTIDSLAGAPTWVAVINDGKDLRITPPAGQVGGSFAFAALVRDPGTGSVSVPITVNVTNQPPTATPDSYTTGPNSITIKPLDNDSDPEGQALRIISASLRSGSGSITVFDDRLVINNLSHGFNEFDYTIVDDDGASSSSTIRILQNNNPVTEDASFVMYDPVLEFDLPAEDADGDPLTVIADGPAGFSTSIFEVNGVLRVRLVAEQAFEPGTETYFFFSVIDPFGAASESVIYLEFDFTFL